MVRTGLWGEDTKTLGKLFYMFICSSYKRQSQKQNIMCIFLYSVIFEQHKKWILYSKLRVTDIRWRVVVELLSMLLCLPASHLLLFLWVALVWAEC